VFNADGSIREWVGVHTDITEQRRAEEALRESERQLRLLAEFMPQIVWSTDKDGYHDYFNQQWYTFTGLSFAATKGTQWQHVLHPDDWERTSELWQHSLATGADYEIEYRMRRADGEYRWLLGRAIPFRNENGEIVRWFGTCTDVHDQKTASVKLEALVEERTRELQRSNEDLQQFAHIASHDLKEPVRKIRTFASRLQEQYIATLPPQAQLYLSKIERSSDRMYAMIDGILLYSSLDAVSQVAEPVDLHELLQTIESDLELLIAEKSATISYGQLPMVKGTAVLYYQVFYNLLNNSLKFIQPDVTPRISITATTGATGEQAFAIITIRDNGIGFAQEDAAWIFQTFSRLNSKDQFEGTGLGLSLCKKIVERHGGWIKAESEPGQGASFTLALPLF
jgi:PAS domain S-box-containing protein